MIRLVGNRLIINKGDTGLFAIPNTVPGHTGALAVLVVYDSLYKTKVIEKCVDASGPVLHFAFTSQDTANLEPRKYYWDIIIYHQPILDEDGFPTDGMRIDSYYGTLPKLPPFIVKGVI